MRDSEMRGSRGVIIGNNRVESKNDVKRSRKIH